jgi:hypothetical protein
VNAANDMVIANIATQIPLAEVLSAVEVVADTPTADRNGCIACVVEAMIPF